jgi:hypothetical protein
VSRVGLGMMSHGDASRRVWHLDFGEARPIVRFAAPAKRSAGSRADRLVVPEFTLAAA